MRLVIVYGYEPSGHACAAAAIEACAEESPGTEVRRVNISKDYHPVLGSALAQVYLQIIQKAPGLWDYLYDHPVALAATRKLRRFYFFLEAGKLARKLKELGPDAVVCTHAVPLGFLAAEKEKGSFAAPLIGVVTDFGVHAYWAHPQADLYLVADDEAAEALASRGVPRPKIKVTGIPIAPAYEQPLGKSEARAELGLSASETVLLLTGGTRGIGPLAEAAGALLKGLPEARLLAACGNNESLLKAMRRLGGRVSAFGGLEPLRMRTLICAADLMIGKAGGVSVAEALACGLPMLLMEPIPGQEERNADYLLRRGPAVQARDIEDLVTQARAALSAGRLASLRERAKALGKPDAARRAAQAVLAVVPVPRG